MKTTIYLLLAIFIIGFISMGLITKPGNAHRVLLQSTVINSSSASLSQSAEIITKRLENFCSEKSEVKVSGENQILVTLTGNWDLKTTEKLIMQKGILEFYETYNFKTLKGLLKDHGDQLLSLLHRNDSRDSSAEIGCIASVDLTRADNYLESAGLKKTVRFAWNNLFDNSEACLYALKVNDGNEAILKGSDLSGFKFNQGESPKNSWIEFKVRQELKNLWFDITKRNINNAIAIVLDSKVISAPIVRDAIPNGNCQISGNFTQNEMRFIAAVAANGELPLSFKIIK